MKRTCIMPNIIEVVGASGTGKSELLHELTKYLKHFGYAYQVDSSEIPAEEISDVPDVDFWIVTRAANSAPQFRFIYKMGLIDFVNAARGVKVKGGVLGQINPA